MEGYSSELCDRHEDRSQIDVRRAHPSDYDLFFIRRNIDDQKRILRYSMTSDSWTIIESSRESWPTQIQKITKNMCIIIAMRMRELKVQQTSSAN